MNGRNPEDSSGQKRSLRGIAKRPTCSQEAEKDGYAKTVRQLPMLFSLYKGVSGRDIGVEKKPDEGVTGSRKRGQLIGGMLGRKSNQWANVCH